MPWRDIFAILRGMRIAIGLAARYRVSRGSTQRYHETVCSKDARPSTGCSIGRNTALAGKNGDITDITLFDRRGHVGSLQLQRARCAFASPPAQRAEGEKH